MRKRRAVYSTAREGRIRAHIRGSASYPDIQGTVTMSAMGPGTWVEVDIQGLPAYVPARGTARPVGPFGFHLHEGGTCTPTEGPAAFSDAGGHFNPDNQPHGNHAGDFPVLFSNHGRARMAFYTDRFTPREAIGRAVIIHLNPDDYITQPAGNSGPRIACGIVGEE